MECFLYDIIGFPGLGSQNSLLTKNNQRFPRDAMSKVTPGTVTVLRRTRITPVWKGFSNGNKRDAKRTQLEHSYTDTYSCKEEGKA